MRARFRGHNSCDEVNKVDYIDRVKMASSTTLEVFNAEVESIDDYKERFDFHCTANQIPEGCRKALFLTRIGRDAFSKLKTLVSPTPLNDLSLDQIVSTMRQHYKKDTVEIAERFKFFKCVQQDNKGVADTSPNLGN